MNILNTVLGGLKSIAITAVIPIIEAEDPAAGKALADGAAAFSDGKLSFEEADQLAVDAIDVAAEKLPKYAVAFAALKKNIAEDVPIIATKIIPDFEATLKAFQNAGGTASV